MKIYIYVDKKYYTGILIMVYLNNQVGTLKMIDSDTVLIQ